MIQKQTTIMQLLAGKNADGIPGLYIALQNGHHEAIREWGKILCEVCEGEPSLTSDQLTELLSAERADSIQGIHMALQQGHHEAIREWGGILREACKGEPSLTSEQLAELLSAKNANGVTGPYIALHRKNAQALNALIDIIKPLRKGPYRNKPCWEKIMQNLTDNISQYDKSLTKLISDPAAYQAYQNLIHALE